MPTRKEILAQLRAKRRGQESSQGRVPLGAPQSELAKLATGFTRQATAPLDIVGLAIEPPYGPEGPGVAGTIGELGGSIVPYLAGEAALARSVPALRSRALLPSVARASTSFGVIGFGREPEPGGSRTEAAVQSALEGAIFGAFQAPKLDPVTGRVIAEASIPRAMVGGAAATVVPLAMGNEIQAPVQITGNATVDAVIENTILAGAMQGLQRWMAARGIQAPPAAPEPPPILPPPPPITDPRRLLNPRVFHMPPAPGAPPTPPSTSAPVGPEAPVSALLKSVVDPTVPGAVFPPEAFRPPVPGEHPELVQARKLLAYHEDLRKDVWRRGTVDLVADDIAKSAANLGLDVDAAIGRFVTPKLAETFPEMERVVRKLMPKAAVPPAVEPVQLELPGGAPDLMPGPGPSIPFVPRGPLETRLKNEHRIQLSQTIPLRQIENLDPLSGPESSEWLGRIAADRPVLLVRGMDKKGLQAAIASGRLNSNRFLEDQRFTRVDPKYREELAKAGTMTWATADPRVSAMFGEYFVVFDANGLRAQSLQAPIGGHLTRSLRHQDEAAAAAILDPIGWERVKFVGRLRSDAGAFDSVPLTDEFALPRVAGASTTVIHGSRGPLVEIVRTTPEQAALESQAADIRSGAKIRRGRLIDVALETGRSIEGARGYDPSVGAINTAGLGQDDLDNLITAIEPTGDQELIQTLLRSKAGLAKQGAKAKAPVPPEKLAEIAADYNRLIAEAKAKGDKQLVKDLVLAKRRGLGGARLGQPTRMPKAGEEVLVHLASGELSPEEALIAKQEASSQGIAIDAAERGAVENELGIQLGRKANQKSAEFARALDQVQQAESGPISTYANMVRALKDMRTPLVGVDGEKFKIAMPDQTIVTLTRDEIEARIASALPPTREVPVFAGPDAPPIAQPVEIGSDDWVQLNLPGVAKEPATYLRPVPEPSEAVVLMSAEREASHLGPAGALVVETPSAAAPPVNAPTPADEMVRAATQIREAQPPAGRTTKLEATTRNVNAFLKARGIERTAQRLPKRHKAAFVKGEAAAKALDVDQAPQGVVVTDNVTGKKTRVRNLDEAARVVAKNPNNEGPVRTDEELKSLFRRRLAATKSARERNAIRRKYALYSDFIRPGDPLRPGETPIASLDGLVNHRVPPVPDLVPQAGGSGRMNLPPGQTPAPPTGPPIISDSIDWSALYRSAVERWIFPAKQWMADISARTGYKIEAYERIFVPLFDGQQQFHAARDRYMERFVKLHKMAPAQDAAERITNYLEAPDKAIAIRDFGLSKAEVHVAAELRKMYDDLFKELGLVGEVDYVQNYSMWRRLHSDLEGGAALNMYHQGQAKPRSYYMVQELERETDGSWAREKNAYKLFHEYLYRGFRKQYLARPHAEAVAYVNDLAKQVPAAYSPVVDQLATFTNDIWTNTEMSRRALNTFYRGVLGRLGVPMAENMRDDFVTVLQQMNVSSLMGLRAPLALRNSIQIFFAYPLFGAKWFGYGLRQAMTQEGYAEARRIFNIVGGPSVPGGDEIFNVLSPLGRVSRWMMTAYSKVDDFTRVASYHAAKGKFLDAAAKARQHGWNLDRFIKEAELESIYHPAEARFLAKMYQGGNVPAAAERAGYLAQQNTNFIYGSGNNPELMRGVAGRLFGQFGVWPASYVQYARYIAQFGTPNQRAAKITRFLAFNTAFGTAGTMLGINTWKWLMFGPVAFTGGPIFQTALDAAKVAASTLTGREDTESALAGARLKRALPGLFVPGHSFLRDVEATIDESQRGLVPAATRALTGQSPESTPVTFGPRGQRKAVLEELRRRRLGTREGG